MPKTYSRLRNSWRPDTQQGLLLQAALCEGHAALRAWETWQHTVDRESLDWGSRRLLPLVHHNVGEPQDPQTWIDNQLIFQETAALVQSLREAGIEVLVLKGVALAHLYYPDAALRPMTDVDLLVRPADAATAMRVMAAAGWSAPGCRAPEHLIPFGRTSEFRHANGTICDLHWKVFRQGRQVADDGCWTRSIPLQVARVQTRTLAPSDQLLLVCVHGADWNEMPSFRWVADATMLVRPGVNWQAVVDEAAERRLMLPLSETLQYLTGFADVPDQVLASLKRLRPTGMERWHHRAATGPHHNLRPLQLAISWVPAWREVPETSVFQKLALFLRYLQALWDVDQLWQTPFRLLQKCLLVVTRMVLRKEPVPRPRSSA